MPPLDKNASQGQGSAPSAPKRDMSQYIRTYAKDVARLTNQPPPASPAPAPAAPPSQAEETVDGVSLPEVDPSPVNRPDGSPKEFTQEVLEVSKEDSDGIFASAPAPEPVAPPPAVDTEREAVLARLRQKIAERETEPTPIVPPPAPPPPPPPPEPVAPLPPPPEPVEAASLGPTPLHTYSSDFSDQIDQNKASTFTVLAAEGDRATPLPTAPRKRRSLVPVALGVLFLALGGGALYGAYVFMGSQEPVAETLGVPSLILADEKMEITGPDYRQGLAAAASEPLVEGNILVTYVTAASSTPLGTRPAPQPGGALIRLLNLGAPDILLRNVDLSSTVGIVAAGGQTQPFFILRVNSYERTFAGMLAWESRILADLAPLYPPHADLTPDTGTATSTTMTPSRSTQGFVDLVVANHDVRALQDQWGRTLLLYGYADRQTLIIARDEAAFTALVARLSATRGE